MEGREDGEGEKDGEDREGEVEELEVLDDLTQNS